MTYKVVRSWFTATTLQEWQYKRQRKIFINKNFFSSIMLLLEIRVWLTLKSGCLLGLRITVNL